MATKRKFILLAPLEPFGESEHPVGSSEAVNELYDYLANEFDNHGHRIHMSIIEEDDRGGFSAVR